MSDTFARVILDSVSPEDVRLTTLHLRYWRPIHAEFMTHRVFSRNGRSSRAVPVATLLKEEPYTPHFMKNQPGMIATEELEPHEQIEAQRIWKEMIDACRNGVRGLNALKVHKQWANRPLEWFGYIDVLVTSTDWANFWALRDHPDAQPEILELARMMKDAMALSQPQLLHPGDWHLPYVTREEFEAVGGAMARKLSTARCARLSYKPFDGDGSHEKEVERYERLVVSQPVHASPAEHQATPDFSQTTEWGRIWANGAMHGNFRGWVQHRKTLKNEAVFDQ